MSKPMLIPAKLIKFKHPHYGDLGTVVLDTVPGINLYCVTDRPLMDPELVRYYRREGERSVRTWLTCGVEVEWEMPDV